jgi:hypothetical protein
MGLSMISSELLLTALKQPFTEMTSCMGAPIRAHTLHYFGAHLQLLRADYI